MKTKYAGWARANHTETEAGEQENAAPGRRLLQAEVLQRLKKIEGQVRGVSRMIEDCRSCGDVVTQLAAIKAAINRVGMTVLACYMAEKMEEDLQEGKDLKESLEECLQIFKKFS